MSYVGKNLKQFCLVSRGNATLELALFAPLAAIFLFGSLDIALCYSERANIDAAVRSGTMTLYYASPHESESRNGSISYYQVGPPQSADIATHLVTIANAVQDRLAGTTLRHNTTRHDNTETIVGAVNVSFDPISGRPLETQTTSTPLRAIGTRHESVFADTSLIEFVEATLSADIFSGEQSNFSSYARVGAITTGDSALYENKTTLIIVIVKSVTIGLFPGISWLFKDSKLPYTSQLVMPLRRDYQLNEQNTPGASE